MAHPALALPSQEENEQHTHAALDTRHSRWHATRTREPHGSSRTSSMASCNPGDPDLLFCRARQGNQLRAVCDNLGNRLACAVIVNDAISNWQQITFCHHAVTIQHAHYHSPHFVSAHRHRSHAQSMCWSCWLRYGRRPSIHCTADVATHGVRASQCLLCVGSLSRDCVQRALRLASSAAVTCVTCDNTPPAAFSMPLNLATS